MNDNKTVSYGILANTQDYHLEKAINTLKLASEYMTVVIQDGEDKEKFFEIKPDSKLIWWQVNK